MVFRAAAVKLKTVWREEWNTTWNSARNQLLLLSVVQEIWGLELSLALTGG